MLHPEQEEIEAPKASVQSLVRHTNPVSQIDQTPLLQQVTSDVNNINDVIASMLSDKAVENMQELLRLWKNTQIQIIFLQRTQRPETAGRIIYAINDLLKDERVTSTSELKESLIRLQETIGQFVGNKSPDASVNLRSKI